VAYIVLVDDDPTVRRLGAALLKSAGHEVADLASGVGLESLLSERRPDLLLLDIQIPGRDGFALLESARNVQGDQPLKVVALSGDTAPDERDRIRAAGFDGFLPKPIDVRGFAAAVRGYLP
jgi:CheY-like chemotaxis protein